METPLTYAGTPINAVVSYESATAGLAPPSLPSAEAAEGSPSDAILWATISVQRPPPRPLGEDRQSTTVEAEGASASATLAVSTHDDFAYMSGVPLLLQDLAAVWQQLEDGCPSVSAAGQEAVVDRAFGESVLAAVEAYTAQRKLHRALRALSAVPSRSSSASQQRSTPAPSAPTGHGSERLSRVFAGDARVFGELLSDLASRRLHEHESTRRRTEENSAAPSASSQQPVWSPAAVAAVFTSVLCAYLRALPQPLLPVLTSRQLETALSRSPPPAGETAAAAQFTARFLRDSMLNQQREHVAYAAVLYLGFVLRLHRGALSAEGLRDVLQCTVREPHRRALEAISAFLWGPAAPTGAETAEGGETTGKTTPATDGGAAARVETVSSPQSLTAHTRAAAAAAKTFGNMAIGLSSSSSSSSSSHSGDQAGADAQPSASNAKRPTGGEPKLLVGAMMPSSSSSSSPASSSSEDNDDSDSGNDGPTLMRKLHAITRPTPTSAMAAASAKPPVQQESSRPAVHSSSSSSGGSSRHSEGNPSEERSEFPDVDSPIQKGIAAPPSEPAVAAAAAPSVVAVTQQAPPPVALNAPDNSSSRAEAGAAPAAAGVAVPAGREASPSLPSSSSPSSAPGSAAASWAPSSLKLSTILPEPPALLRIHSTPPHPLSDASEHSSGAAVASLPQLPPPAEPHAKERAPGPTVPQVLDPREQPASLLSSETPQSAQDTVFNSQRGNGDLPAPGAVLPAGEHTGGSRSGVATATTTSSSRSSAAEKPPAGARMAASVEDQEPAGAAQAGEASCAQIQKTGAAADAALAAVAANGIEGLSVTPGQGGDAAATRAASSPPAALGFAARSSTSTEDAAQGPTAVLPPAPDGVAGAAGASCPVDAPPSRPAFVSRLEIQERQEPRLRALHAAKQSFLSGYTRPSEPPRPSFTPSAPPVPPSAALSASAQLLALGTALQTGDCTTQQAASQLRFLLSTLSQSAGQTLPHAQPWQPQRYGEADSDGGPGSRLPERAQDSQPSLRAVDTSVNATLPYAESTSDRPRSAARMPDNREGSTRAADEDLGSVMDKLHRLESSIAALQTKLSGRAGHAVGAPEKEPQTVHARGAAPSTAATDADISSSYCAAKSREMELHALTQRCATLEREEVKRERASRLLTAKLADVESQLDRFRDDQTRLKMLLTETQLQNATLRDAVLSDL